MENWNNLREWVMQNPEAVALIEDVVWVGIGACLGTIGGYATGHGMKAMDKKYKENSNNVETENAHLRLMFYGAVIGAVLVAAAQLP